MKWPQLGLYFEQFSNSEGDVLPSNNHLRMQKEVSILTSVLDTHTLFVLSNYNTNV